LGLLQLGSKCGTIGDIMTYIYEELEEGFMLKRTDENGKVCYIPKDPANSDYQAYLKYLEENN
jgi:hypothetical protein